MKKTLLGFMAILNIAFGASYNYKDINANEAIGLQKNGALLIDVRSVQEFAFSRAPNSKNIPIYFEENGKRVLNQNFVEQIDYFVGSNKNKPIILICRSGSRTKEAAKILTQEGYENIYNIQKGFLFDWIPSGLPIEK